MPVTKQGFIDVIQASADYLGNGAIEVNRYESEIVDMIRRTSVALTRFDHKKATGHPHRYFEQVGIATAAFTDPRNIVPTATSASRQERSAFVKAIVAQSNLTLFDVDVTRMQGQFAGLEAKDIEDIMSAIIVQEATAVWTGNDTSLVAPTTTQYQGVISQITNQATISPGASIIDGLKAEVAFLASNTTYRVKPTCIYINPILQDLIDREAKAQSLQLDKVTLSGGVEVSGINTVVGVLPLVSDPFLQPVSGLPSATLTNVSGFANPPAGNKTYWAVILTESEVEMPTITGDDGNLNPRLFQLGLLANLTGQYVGVHFNTVIAKAYNYAHAVVAVQRP
jgi:hypothetical protein